MAAKVDISVMVNALFADPSPPGFLNKFKKSEGDDLRERAQHLVDEAVKAASGAAAVSPPDLSQFYKSFKHRVDEAHLDVRYLPWLAEEVLKQARPAQPTAVKRLAEGLKPMCYKDIARGIFLGSVLFPEVNVLVKKIEAAVDSLEKEGLVAFSEKGDVKKALKDALQKQLMPEMVKALLEDTSGLSLLDKFRKHESVSLHKSAQQLLDGVVKAAPGTTAVNQSEISQFHANVMKRIEAMHVDVNYSPWLVEEIFKQVASKGRYALRDIEKLTKDLKTMCYKDMASKIPFCLDFDKTSRLAEKSGQLLDVDGFIKKINQSIEDVVDSLEKAGFVSDKEPVRTALNSAFREQHRLEIERKIDELDKLTKTPQNEEWEKAYVLDIENQITTLTSQKGEKETAFKETEEPLRQKLAEEKKTERDAYWAWAKDWSGKLKFWQTSGLRTIYNEAKRRVAECQKTLDDCLADKKKQLEEGVLKSLKDLEGRKNVLATHIGKEEMKKLVWRQAHLVKKQYEQLSKFEVEKKLQN